MLHDNWLACITYYDICICTAYVIPYTSYFHMFFSFVINIFFRIENSLVLRIECVVLNFQALPSRRYKYVSVRKTLTIEFSQFFSYNYITCILDKLKVVTNIKCIQEKKRERDQLMNWNNIRLESSLQKSFTRPDKLLDSRWRYISIKRPSDKFAETVYFVSGNVTEMFLARLKLRILMREKCIVFTTCGSRAKIVHAAQEIETDTTLYPASCARLLGTIMLFFPLYRSPLTLVREREPS